MFCTILQTSCVCIHYQISSVGLEKELLHVTAGHVRAQKRLIYTQSNGLVEAPSGFSWVLKTKQPFTKPLLGEMKHVPHISRLSLFQLICTVHLTEEFPFACWYVHTCMYT